jgi:hypothetical protein
MFWPGYAAHVGSLIPRPRIRPSVATIVTLILFALSIIIVISIVNSPRKIADTRSKARREIEKTLYRWNDIKIKVTHDLTEDRLRNILTGDALMSNIAAIRGLSKQHAYWKITTHKFTVKKVTLVDNYHAEAYVDINESGTYYVGQNPLKGPPTYRRSRYEAYYRLILQNGKWLIYENRKIKSL